MLYNVKNISKNYAKTSRGFCKVSISYQSISKNFKKFIFKIDNRLLIKWYFININNFILRWKIHSFYDKTTKKLIWNITFKNFSLKNCLSIWLSQNMVYSRSWFNVTLVGLFLIGIMPFSYTILKITCTFYIFYNKKRWVEITCNIKFLIWIFHLWNCFF